MNNDIVKLREETGAGVIECKRALEESKGDLEKAKKIIYERGFAKAEKKQDRVTGAGLLEAYIHNGRIGVLLELRCETDFVARSEPMKTLSKDLVLQIASMAPKNVEELETQPFIKNDSMKVKDVVTQVIAQLGENIKISQFSRFQI